MGKNLASQSKDTLAVQGGEYWLHVQVSPKNAADPEENPLSKQSRERSWNCSSPDTELSHPRRW